MKSDVATLDAHGLQLFHELRAEAINDVTQRFYATDGALYAKFGAKGREACREDLAFHLEFLRPVLEFGMVQPMVDYVRWLTSVLATRGIPSEHLPVSLGYFADFFAANLASPAAQIVVAALNRVQAAALERDDAQPAIYGMMPERWPQADAFESALLAGDRHAAAALLERCFEQGHSLVDAELHVIQPALYGIGQKWQNNQVTVAQEHLATAIAQSVMMQGLLRSTIPAPIGMKVLLACVEGNNHAVGLQMVADSFQLSGWEVQLLGANVPTGALIQQVGLYKPNLLAVSVSFAQQFRTLKDAIALLAETLGTARPPVIVGGLAFNQFSRIADGLGADGWSPDARTAIASASKLIAQPDLR